MNVLSLFMYQSGGKGLVAKEAPKVVAGTIPKLLHRLISPRVMGEMMQACCNIAIATVNLLCSWCSLYWIDSLFKMHGKKVQAHIS